jgi:hypothetical protein
MRVGKISWGSRALGAYVREKAVGSSFEEKEIRSSLVACEKHFHGKLFIIKFLCYLSLCFFGDGRLLYKQYETRPVYGHRGTR